jgi:hypothetical protein
MTNQQLMDAGREQMTQTDQAIDRSKMVALRTTLTLVNVLSCQIYRTSFL